MSLKVSVELPLGLAAAIQSGGAAVSESDKDAAFAALETAVQALAHDIRPRDKPNKTQPTFKGYGQVLGSDPDLYATPPNDNSTKPVNSRFSEAEETRRPLEDVKPTDPSTSAGVYPIFFERLRRKDSCAASWQGHYD